MICIFRQTGQFFFPKTELTFGIDQVAHNEVFLTNQTANLMGLKETFSFKKFLKDKKRKRKKYNGTTKSNRINFFRISRQKTKIVKSLLLFLLRLYSNCHLPVINFSSANQCDKTTSKLSQKYTNSKWKWNYNWIHNTTPSTK